MGRGVGGHKKPIQRGGLSEKGGRAFEQFGNLRGLDKKEGVGGDAFESG